MNTVEFTIDDWKYVALHDPSNGNLFVQIVESRRSAEEIKIALEAQRQEVENQQNIFLKAASYLKAEASKLVSGPVELPIIEARRAACDGCEGCDKKSEEEWYCDKCGCPKWDRSRLQVKWEMPAASCPLGKWPNVG